jgi:beta-galactosidase
MEKADYTFKLRKGDGIFIQIDHAQLGLGGIHSWGAVPLESYLVFAEEFHYNYLIRPIPAGTERLINEIHRVFDRQ